LEEGALGYRIRELGIGGILDDAIELFKVDFKNILKMLVYCFIPCSAILNFLQSFFQERMSTGQSDSELIGFSLMMLVTGVYILVLYGLILPVTSGFISHNAAALYLGKPASFGDSLRKARSLFPRILAVVLLTNLMVTIGSCMCFIPGLIAQLFLFVTVPVVVLEESKVFDTFGRSIALMKGDLLKAFITSTIVGIISFGLGGGAGYFLPMIAKHSLVGLGFASVASAIGTGCTTAFTILVSVVFYFSARSRAEHLDLVLMANRMWDEVQPQGEQL